MKTDKGNDLMFTYKRIVRVHSVGEYILILHRALCTKTRESRSDRGGFFTDATPPRSKMAFPSLLGCGLVSIWHGALGSIYAHAHERSWKALAVSGVERRGCFVGPQGLAVPINGGRKEGGEGKEIPRGEVGSPVAIVKARLPDSEAGVLLPPRDV